MSKNRFVFVACGAREHIDTLHFSLRYLKHFSKNDIIVVTDSLRNEIPVVHSDVVDVKTPADFTNHQASIYLKVGLNKFLPAGYNYCYLDTDVIALNDECDKIFEQKHGPIIFAPDHCKLPEFSYAAVKCGCREKYEQRIAGFEQLEKKYSPPKEAYDPIIEKKRIALLEKFEAMKKDKLTYFFIALRFLFTFKTFKLDEDTYFDRWKKIWHDKDGRSIITQSDDVIKKIEKNSQWRWNTEKKRWYDADGQYLYQFRCDHLAAYIKKRFGIEVKDLDFQHWNGGVFLFDDSSSEFLNKWFDLTMQIFTFPEWTTRDQGSLIATAWYFGLENNPLLPKKYNFIADYYGHATQLDADGNFSNSADGVKIKPALVHVYHNFGMKGWDIWDYIEEVGMEFA